MAFTDQIVKLHITRNEHSLAQNAAPAFGFTFAYLLIDEIFNVGDRRKGYATGVLLGKCQSAAQGSVASHCGAADIGVLSAESHPEHIAHHFGQFLGNHSEVPSSARHIGIKAAVTARYHHRKALEIRVPFDIGAIKPCITVVRASGKNIKHRITVCGRIGHSVMGKNHRKM